MIVAPIHAPAARSAAELRAAAGPGGPREPKDGFQWSKAMALPAYVYGGAASGLSSLAGWAESHPAGGIVIGPGGIHRLPDWPRHFEPHTLAGRLQPILSGVAAGLHLVRAGAELVEGYKTGDNLAVIAGSLDLVMAGASVAAIANPALGGGVGLALLAARGLLDLHRAA